jgi:proteasome lid subunit RPN8/RPN11
MAAAFSAWNRPAPESSVWSVTGHAPSIEYFPILLDEIRAYATDGLNRLRHGGIEVGGVLFGAKDGDRIRILGWRSLDCEHAQGPGFVLSPNDEAALRTLIAESATDPQLSGLEPVGWFHSHTRSGVCLSDLDLGVYDCHFPRPWQIAMVLRPSQLGPAEVGFFFREQDGKVHSESSYNPFTVNPLLTPQASPALEVEPVSSPPRQLAPPVAQALLRAASRTIPVHARADATHAKWLWLMAAAVLAALGIGVLAVVFHDSGHSPGHPNLNLRAYDHGGQVRIEWDRSAEPILSAGKAYLFITEGDQVLETEVSPELLHHGSMVYQRRSPNVEIRLWVTGADSGPLHELTRLIGLPAAPSIPIERAKAADSAAPPIAKAPRVAAVEKGKRPAVARRIVTEPAPAAASEQAAPAEPPPEPSVRASIAAPAPAAPLRLPPAPKKPSLVYDGPTTGRLIWTGNLNARAALEIDGDRASTGDLTGRLPKAPVKVRVHPANFSRRGIDVFASELPSQKEIREQPSANNGWTETVYKRNPKRAGDVVVTETPSAQNKWKRIGVRAGDRGVSVIVVDWEVMPREN